MQAQTHKKLLEKIPSIHQIPRLSSTDAHTFYEEFYAKKRPVIITNALEGWECAQTWTLDYLKEKIGWAKHTFQYEGRKTVSMQVSEYFDIAFSQKTKEEYQAAFPALPSASERLPYMRHFGPLHGTLFSQYPIQSLFPNHEQVKFISYLFCGVPSTKTNCHYDWSDNFVGVVRGQKHVTLLPPKAERSMTIDEKLREELAQGECNFFEDPPDLHLRLETYEPGKNQRMMHEHPVLQSCPSLYYSPLWEGDLVFFPAYWYHYFHNVEPSISVTTQTALRHTV